MNCILYVADAGSIHTRRWAEYQRDLGREVHVASFRQAVIPGVAVHVLPTLGLGRAGYMFAIPALRSLARRVHPDVVHAQYVTSYGFLAAVAKLHPLVLTAWGTDVLISPRESRLALLFARYAVRHADEVTTVAEHMNASVAALGVAQERVQAVPFGVDAQVFCSSVAARDAGQRIKIICTRNFAPIYDIPTLLSALEELSREGLDFEADLVGEGALRIEFESRVHRSAHLATRVRFYGHVPHVELARMLARADIFVTPALSDGNNVSLNEAMACGCFPIGTAIPANAQWLDDGVNGLLYPPGDHAALACCIRKAANNIELRERAAKVNRDIVERKADWRICVRRMEDVYASAITRAHGAIA
ncbi:MAG: glycosyltransferase [Steroidobacteraceae bacterium]